MHRHPRRAIDITLLAAAFAVTAAAQDTGAGVTVAAPVPPAPQEPVNRPDSAGNKHNVLPAVEIGAFLVALNLYDRVAYRDLMQDGKRVYYSTWQSTWDHIRQQRWVHDIDPFSVNQFQHPYQGATMYALARSSGHDFWTSLILANIGSFAWKMAGETDPPSINDQITTGQAGSLLGEALYRMSDLILREGGKTPHRAREYSASLISPATGLNRRIFGNRFKAELPETNPVTKWEVRVGGTVNALAHTVTSPLSVLRSDITVQFNMGYGLPGQPGYEYNRPLDYFNFQFSALANAKNPIENVMIRGLLFGAKTGESATTHGIWGVYGSYDYISPTSFRVSSTAASLGTTREIELGKDVALQGSTLLGVGFGAAGSNEVLLASTPTNAAIRDYHFGVTPQALIALRFISGDRAMFEMNAREYYVSGLGSDDTHGSETIFRGDFGVTVRVYGRNAIGLQVSSSSRNASYGLQPGRKSSEQTLTLSYSILGGNGFTAVK